MRRILGTGLFAASMAVGACGSNPGENSDGVGELDVLDAGAEDVSSDSRECIDNNVCFDDVGENIVYVDANADLPIPPPIDRDLEPHDAAIMPPRGIDPDAHPGDDLDAGREDVGSDVADIMDAVDLPTGLRVGAVDVMSDIDGYDLILLNGEEYADVLSVELSTLGTAITTGGIRLVEDSDASFEGAVGAVIMRIRDEEFMGEIVGEMVEFDTGDFVFDADSTEVFFDFVTKDYGAGRDGQAADRMEFSVETFGVRSADTGEAMDVEYVGGGVEAVSVTPAAVSDFEMFEPAEDADNFGVGRLHVAEYDNTDGSGVILDTIVPNISVRVVTVFSGSMDLDSFELTRVGGTGESIPGVVSEIHREGDNYSITFDFVLDDKLVGEDGVIPMGEHADFELTGEIGDHFCWVVEAATNGPSDGAILVDTAMNPRVTGFCPTD